MSFNNNYESKKKGFPYITESFLMGRKESNQKKKGKDQESIKSNTTPYPGYQ